MPAKLQITFTKDYEEGKFNLAFLGTSAGMLKIAEIVLAFIAFVLSICSDRRVTSAAWTEHITFATMFVVSGLLVGYVLFPHLTVGDSLTRQGLLVTELLFYGVHTVFYFASIWMMVHLSSSWETDRRAAAIVDTVVCVALTVLFAVETAMKLKTIVKEVNESPDDV